MHNSDNKEIFTSDQTPAETPALVIHISAEKAAEVLAILDGRFPDLADVVEIRLVIKEKFDK